MKAPNEETALEWVRMAGGAVMDSTHQTDVVSWKLAGAVHVRFWHGTGTLLVQGPEPHRTQFHDALKSIADVAPTPEPQKPPKVIQTQLSSTDRLVVLRDDGKVFVDLANVGHPKPVWKEVELPN